MGAEVSGGTATVIAWMIKLDQSALDAPGDQIAQSAEDAVNRGIAAANGQASRRSGRDSGRRIRQSWTRTQPRRNQDQACGTRLGKVAGAGRSRYARIWLPSVSRRLW